jgi:hypothetical protein
MGRKSASGSGINMSYLSDGGAVIILDGTIGGLPVGIVLVQLLLQHHLNKIILPILWAKLKSPPPKKIKLLKRFV